MWRLMNDDRVPSWLKIGVPMVVLLYFVSPIDLIPDFLLGLGQLDDIGVLLMGMAIFIRLAPERAVNEHRSALGMDHEQGPTSGGEPTRRVSQDQAPIEGEYRVADKASRNGKDK